MTRGTRFTASGTPVNKSKNATLRRVRKATGFTILVATCASMLAGCMSFNPRSLSTMERALMASNPDLVIASSTKFGFGALTLDFVDFAFVHDRSIDVSKISRADIGIYTLRDALALEDFRAPDDGADGRCPRRDVIVRVREDDGYFDVIACIRNERVTGLSLFMVEPKEIVVINTRGDFEGLIDTLVRSNMNGEKRAQERARKRSEEQRNPVVAEQDAGESLPPS